MKILVAFYSRTGNTRKVAEDISEIFSKNISDHVDLEDLKETKDRSGISGYALAGRDAALKKPAILKPLVFHASDYDLVLIGGPVWAWTICPAIRTYCGKEGVNASRLGFFCSMGGSGDNRAFSEMTRVCGREADAVLGLKDGDIRAGSREYFSRIEKFCFQLREAS